MDFDFRVVLLLVTLFIAGFWFLFRPKSSGISRGHPVVLILGPSGSGKTALFHRLLSGVFRDTVSSLKQNRELVTIESSQIDLIDYPGHSRLRAGLIPLLPKASKIYFLVDPSDKAQVKAGAEQLFDLLSNRAVNCSVRILVSKSEKSGQKSAKFLGAELEKEIERLRKSRDGEGRFLGVDNLEFSFPKNHAPVPVSFGASSAKSGETLI